MDKSVAELNIAHFKRLMETETDANKRKMLKQLLAEEEEKLASILKSGRPSLKSSRD